YGRARDGDGDHAELPRSDPGPVGMDGDPGPSGAGGLHRVHGGEQVMALKVAGLDLSMTATGVAHTGDDDQSVCTHLIKSLGKGDGRLVDIRSQVLARISGCELVLIDDLPTHAHSAGITGMVHGAVREGLLSAGIPYATVPPATLKKYATGRGNCDKTAMAVAAYRRSEREFADDNQCDAWWLWVMARDLTGDPVFGLPKVQRDALSKVKKEG